MEAKIDKNGFLWVKIGENFKQVACPFTMRRKWKFRKGYCWEGIQCGNWCALFEEPIFSQETNMWEITLCQKILYFYKLIDERNKKE